MFTVYDYSAAHESWYDEWVRINFAPVVDAPAIALAMWE